VVAAQPRRVGAAEPPALALPDKPSIAVLPFQNMSGDPEQEYFAEGMVEEIITALSRIRWLFVIARNSSFTYKGQAVDVKRVGRELGVRYVLEGSVRKAGGRVRITAQLIEAESGAHLWADRFDGSLEDVFDLQDQVAFNVAGVIEPTLQAAEGQRAASRPTTDLGAYDLYLRALPVMFRLTKEDLSEAASLLDRAIERDPRYGPALAFASICHMHLAREGRTDDSAAGRTRAVELARRALEVAHNDPVALTNGAHALACFGEDLAQMKALVDRALILNPSYARGWYASGLLHLLGGNAETAIEHVEKSLRLSPRDYVGVPLLIIGSAHFVARRFELAIENFTVVARQIPAYPPTYRMLAACYAHLGRMDEARGAIDQLRSIGAAVMPDSNSGPLVNAELRELLLSGLRLATGEGT
jgi:adenylate cyclase